MPNNDNICFKNFLTDLRKQKQDKKELISNLFDCNISSIIISYLPRDILLGLYDQCSSIKLIYDDKCLNLNLVLNDNNANGMTLNFIKTSQNNGKLIFRQWQPNIFKHYYYYLDEKTHEYLHLDIESDKYFVDLYDYTICRGYNDNDIFDFNLYENLRSITIFEWINESLGIFIIDYSYMVKENKFIEMRCIYCGKVIRKLNYYYPIGSSNCSIAVDTSPFNKNTNYYCLYKQEEGPVCFEIRDLYTDDLKYKFICSHKVNELQNCLFVFSDQIYIKHMFNENSEVYNLDLNYENLTFRIVPTLKKYTITGNL